MVLQEPWLTTSHTDLCFCCTGLDTERILVTNMDADAQVPALYVEEVDRAAAAAENPHALVSFFKLQL